MALDYTFEEEKHFRRVSWNWAKAADTKDWDLLRSISASTVKLLYSGLGAGMKDEVREREDYVVNFAQAHLGDQRLLTQHMLGAVVFAKQGPDTAMGSWQARARHLRTLKDGTIAEWTGATYVNHYYERIDGEWKLAGVEPHTRLWEVGAYSNVFGDFA